MKNEQKKPLINYPLEKLATVSQLDKTQLPTDEASLVKGSSVGRHSEEKLTFSNHKIAKKHVMNYFLNLMDNLYPTARVVYHTSDYINLAENYFLQSTIRSEKHEVTFFLRWVRIITLMNQENRKKVDTNTFETKEQDFLMAFQILSCFYQENTRHINLRYRIIDKIHKKYRAENFTALDIATDLNRSKHEIERILNHMALKGTLKNTGRYYQSSSLLLKKFSKLKSADLD